MRLHDIVPEETTLERYHQSKKPRASKIAPELRKFIAWDGEGINLSGEGKPQSYVLFGSSEGCIAHPDGLNTWDCLDFILRTGEKNPAAFHIGFAFSYDVNMIIAGLSQSTLTRLHKNGWVRIKREDNTYVLRFAKGKWFSVSRQEKDYDSKTNRTAKLTVRIHDIFSFFQSSFIKAYEKNIGPVPDIIRSGKAGRRNFTLSEFGNIRQYWAVEIQMLRELAEELRKRCYGAGLRITEWHGPGALASHAMKLHGVKKHMKEHSDEIKLAARYAYAGGRFELYKLGRVIGPIYSIDINSAYPAAISMLPSFAEGEWVYADSESIRCRLKDNGNLPNFGLWKVRLFDRSKRGFDLPPSPLFHRDLDHNISFPWHVSGYYYTHEAMLAAFQGAEIHEGWFYRGGSTKPFSWIPEMYETRRKWKDGNIPSQLALKLCMNSVYGKLAQRVGYDEKSQRIPPWHQLEWAGWVTGYTRAKLYALMKRIPYEDLIAVETDGIYTTYPPEKLGITDSRELGEWSITVYKELMYVQSGLAWLCDTNGVWSEKRRGLDPGSFTRESCQEYLRNLNPNTSWPNYQGTSTRFIGLGQALQSRSFYDNHCVWHTAPREIASGSRGKRIHNPRICRACTNGNNAYEQAHDLVIFSRSMVDIRSVPHSVPWEPIIGRQAWKDTAEDDGPFFLEDMN